jgi:hypothetical protein
MVDPARNCVVTALPPFLAEVAPLASRGAVLWCHAALGAQGMEWYRKPQWAGAVV